MILRTRLLSSRRHMLHQLVNLVVALAVLIQNVSAEFAEIENVPSAHDVTFISIDPLCSNPNELHIVPNFVIEPADAAAAVQIFSDPPNLVAVKTFPDGNLFFELTDVAFGIDPTTTTADSTASPPTQAGVRIVMPYDKLESVSVIGPYQVQILGSPNSNGFTNLQQLTVDNLKGSSSSTNVTRPPTTLYATLVDLNADDELTLATAGDFTNVIVQSAAPVQLRARGDSSTHDIQAQAPTVLGRFHGHGDLLVDGSLGSMEQNLTHFGDGTVRTTSDSCEYYEHPDLVNSTNCEAGTQATVSVPALPDVSTRQTVGDCDTMLSTSGSAIHVTKMITTLSVWGSMAMMMWWLGHEGIGSTSK